jgi:glycosyltransferase involved in cell wall biosynthesis
MADAITGRSAGGSIPMTDQRSFGDEGRKGLIIKMSLTPIDDPVSGSGMMHRVLADTLQKEGYDVVVIEANGKPNGLGDTQYRVETLLFDGTQDNPYFAKHQHLYADQHTSLPFNFPGFTAGLATSSLKFADLKPNQLGSYLMASGWAFRSAALVYGQPSMAWNGHAWIQNYITGSAPTIFTVHGTASNPRYGAPAHSFRPIVNEGLASSYMAIAPSHLEFDNVTALGMPADRVTVMPNGYNESVFSLSDPIEDLPAYRRDLIAERINGVDLSSLDPSSKWVLFVGRAAHAKGLDLLLEAFSRVLIQEPNTNLIIIGGGNFDGIVTEGDKKLNLYSLAEELGIKERVFFTGAMPQEKTARFLDAADIGAYSSRSESFGLTLAEAFAKGLRCVASRNDGYQFIVDQYDGPENDVARMVPNDDIRLPEVREAAKLRIGTLTDYSEDIRTAAVEYIDGASVEVLNRRYNASSVSSATELADGVLKFVSQQRAIDGIADGLVIELGEDPAVRRSRGEIASRFAASKFTITKVMEEGFKIVDAAKRAEEYRSPHWDLKDGERGEVGPMRQERLDNIKMDGDVARAFAKLRDGIGTDQFGKYWRSFNTLVTRFFGHADLMHPIDLEAVPNFPRYPNSIFRELARVAGVTEGDMVRVMVEVDKTPHDALTGPAKGRDVRLERGRVETLARQAK